MLTSEAFVYESVNNKLWRCEGEDRLIKRMISYVNKSMTQTEYNTTELMNSAYSNYALNANDKNRFVFLYLPLKHLKEFGTESIK